MLHTQAEGDVLEHRHVLEQRIVLEYEADLTLAHIDRGGVFAGEQHTAGIGRLQPRDDAQQRGLAAAGRPQQRHELARFDIANFDTHACLRLNRPRQATAGLRVAVAAPGYSTGRSAARRKRALRHSTTFLATSVTSASNASSEATANAAE
ncbi:hypothetical protein G6F31_018430 [Rhizopus arrhizus]|nr:hypothetical protein G6F31_018430 [Rhizopus arrhizus]